MGAVVRSTDSYRPGRGIEVLRPTGACRVPVALLWHGSGPDERDALVPLASVLASHGALALVPDWRSDDPVVGADELLASIAFTLEAAAGLGGDPDRVVLVGWSLGASAAADIALHPDISDGWQPAALVGLGGGYDRALFAGHGASPLDVDGQVRGPGRTALLVHGTSDTVVPPDRSVVGTAALDAAGWNATLRHVGTDHAGVIGTVYDRAVRRCVPVDDPDRLAALALVASEVAGVVLGPDGPEGRASAGV